MMKWLSTVLTIVLVILAGLFLHFDKNQDPGNLSAMGVGVGPVDKVGLYLTLAFLTLLTTLFFWLMHFFGKNKVSN